MDDISNTRDDVSPLGHVTEHSESDTDVEDRGTKQRRHTVADVSQHIMDTSRTTSSKSPITAVERRYSYFPDLVPQVTEVKDNEVSNVEDEEQPEERSKQRTHKSRKTSLGTVVNLAKNKSRPVKASFGMAAKTAMASSRFSKNDGSGKKKYKKKIKETKKDWMAAAEFAIGKPLHNENSSSYKDPEYDDDGSYLLVKPRWLKAWKAALRKLELVLPATTGMKGEGDESDESEDEEGDSAARKAEKLQRVLENVHIEMEEEGGPDPGLTATVNGMRQFGISKGNISRAVVNFAEPPQPCPLTACFQFPHTFLNHSYVRHMVLSRIKDVPRAKIMSVQYVDRNVFHGTRSLDNRWIIRVNNTAAYKTLLASGIEVCNRRIQMRSYDAVLQDEFQEYKEYLEHQKKYMMDKFKNITGAQNTETLDAIRAVTDQVLPDPERHLSASNHL